MATHGHRAEPDLLRRCSRPYIGDMAEIPHHEASEEVAAAELDGEAEAEARLDVEAQAAATLDPEAEDEL